MAARGSDNSFHHVGGGRGGSIPPRTPPPSEVLIPAEFENYLAANSGYFTHDILPEILIHTRCVFTVWNVNKFFNIMYVLCVPYLLRFEKFILCYSATVVDAI
jgi:hypothetical protein